MRCRLATGLVGLGCAGLMVLMMVTPAAANYGGGGAAGYDGGRNPECDSGRATGCGGAGSPPDSGGGGSGYYRGGGECPGGSSGGCGPRSAQAQEVAADCEQAAMDPPYRAVGFKVVTEVPDGATVAPGQDIRVRVTWDPKAWSGPDLDAALACVAVKGGLDGNLSSGERPTANDGVFEYVLHVPDNIRPGCDICVQGFLTGTGTDGNPQQVTGDRPCFMSGPPPEPPKPPVTRPPGPPATTPTTTAVPPRTPAEVPTPIEGGKAGDGSSTGTEVSGGELPRTGSLVTRLATAGGGLTLSLGGLAVIGGARRRSRRRANR